MILFVFEGKSQEPEIYKTIESLFFVDENIERVYFSYCSNIYNFYSKIKKEGLFENDDASLVLLLLKELKSHPELNPQFPNININNVSQIFIFFDYDIQHSRATKGEKTKEYNDKIQEMLSFFNDETAHGKLYINYPMFDSYRYTDKVPDEKYVEYEVSLAECKHFKEKLAREKPFYRDKKKLKFRNETNKYRNNDDILRDWKFINQQNISKANFICNSENNIPKDKNTVSQNMVFGNELQKYVYAKNSVAILNAFPLFLLEYFKNSDFILP